MALECAAFYSPTPDSFKNFETVSRARRSSFGEGLPGSTWKSRSVVCFPDLLKEENFPRLSVAALEHLRTGVAFSLYVGKKVLGVIEFFSLEHRFSLTVFCNSGRFSPSPSLQGTANTSGTFHTSRRLAVLSEKTCNSGTAKYSGPDPDY